MAAAQNFDHAFQLIIPAKYGIQLAFLRNHRCDEYQGFYCSPAVPAAAIPALVAARQR